MFEDTTKDRKKHKILDDLNFSFSQQQLYKLEGT